MVWNLTANRLMVSGHDPGWCSGDIDASVPAIVITGSLEGVRFRSSHDCKLGNRCFKRPSSLRFHTNTHSGFATPFRCPYPGCRRSFSNRSNADRHYHNHTNALIPFQSLQSSTQVDEIDVAHIVDSRCNIGESMAFIDQRVECSEFLSLDGLWKGESSAATSPCSPITTNAMHTFHQEGPRNTLDPDDSATYQVAEFPQDISIEPVPFQFKPYELAHMLDSKSYHVLRAIGGSAGLLRGLGVDSSQGLNPEQDATSLTRVGAMKEKGIINILDSDETPATPPRHTAHRLPSASSSPAPSEDSVAFEASIMDRRKVYGENTLPPRPSKTLSQLMFAAMKDKVLILLTIAVTVSLALGFFQKFRHPRDPKQPPIDWVEGVAVTVAMLIVVIVGSVNDWQKERQFKALNNKKEERGVRVIRGGRETLVDVKQVVVGDIAILEPGEIVPCDGMFLSGHSVRCDESESDAIRKVSWAEWTALRCAGQSNSGGDPSVGFDLHSQLAHTDCFVVSGSKVLEGIGRYVVVAVGQKSFNGKIMMALRARSQNTPLPILQPKLNYLAELVTKLGNKALFTALMYKWIADLRVRAHALHEVSLLSFLSAAVFLTFGLGLLTDWMKLPTIVSFLADILLRVIVSRPILLAMLIFCFGRTFSPSPYINSTLLGFLTLSSPNNPKPSSHQLPEGHDSHDDSDNVALGQVLLPRWVISKSQACFCWSILSMSALAYGGKALELSAFFVLVILCDPASCLVDSFPSLKRPWRRHRWNWKPGDLFRSVYPGSYLSIPFIRTRWPEFQWFENSGHSPECDPWLWRRKSHNHPRLGRQDMSCWDWDGLISITSSMPTADLDVCNHPKLSRQDMSRWEWDGLIHTPVMLSMSTTDPPGTDETRSRFLSYTLSLSSLEPVSIVSPSVSIALSGCIHKPQLQNAFPPFSIYLTRVIVTVASAHDFEIQGATVVMCENYNVYCHCQLQHQHQYQPQLPLLHNHPLYYQPSSRRFYIPPHYGQDPTTTTAQHGSYHQHQSYRNPFRSRNPFLSRPACPSLVGGSRWHELHVQLEETREQIELNIVRIEKRLSQIEKNLINIERAIWLLQHRQHPSEPEPEPPPMDE
ncbi:plasma membrane calcium [Stygiomarasmius scandens]|uniref:Plasma membrane calcium n=1 Tax=Marasmiellus scandens TaxID=2682957 RepID=A0ABR1J0X8_9AGAR